MSSGIEKIRPGPRIDGKASLLGRIRLETLLDHGRFVFLLGSITLFLTYNPLFHSTYFLLILENFKLYFKELKATVETIAN